MATTLMQIALEVGVDRSLVSRVLRGDPKVRVSEAKRQQILAVSKAMGYRPNRVGRSLRTGQAFVIGMLTPDVTNPFHSILFRGVEAAATAAGYNTILCNTDDSVERFKDVVSLLAEGHVDGLLVATAKSHDPAIDWLSQVGLPYILINRRRRDQTDPWIGPDDFQTGLLGGKHLLSLGHTRIVVLVGILDHDNLRLRVEGFLAAIREHAQGTVQHTVVDNLATRAAARECVTTLLELPPDRRPTAIFALQTHTSDGALHAIYRRGLRIPQDISILGYSASSEPEISCIQAPVDKIGRLAAEYLIERLQRSEPINATDINVTIPVSLLDRGSTSRAPEPQLAKRHQRTRGASRKAPLRHSED